MSKLRKSARNQECTIRVPNICNWNNETTILAHLGGAGIGIKNNDIFAAFCCSSCHDAIDGRIKTEYTYDELKLMHFYGIKRTQQYWIDNNYLKVI